MADKRRPTIFQSLNHMFGFDNSIRMNYAKTNSRTYGSNNSNLLYKTKDKSEYETKKLEFQQNKYLRNLWKRAQVDSNAMQLMAANEVKLMYREVDLMDGFPEIGAALDITMEEACYVPVGKYLVNVDSKSERIKSILQDLFVNRLSCNTILPMILRSTSKYGNTFMLLNITNDNGIIGWKQLPVYEMERYESGMENPYINGFKTSSNSDLSNDESTKFVWVGSSTYKPYFNWQIAHFRLLYDSLYLPYGVSMLNKARRHWRMLSMMEDMMLMYRLERSVERRVFKIPVGAMDEDDVQAYVEQVANEFKRTPVYDPKTGQMDLRKNLMGVMDDFFIPVREPGDPSPIETLQGAQNLQAMDDIKYVQNKVCTALRVPKSFLNFEEAQGDGKNLSLLDVRFTRTVIRIQQMILMELNKIAIIHLYLLGFTDDLTNFTLSMNNPSSQAEQLELDNINKKISIATAAIADPGTGMPLMSLHRAQKEILGWSDKDIKDNLEELRLEKALAQELQQTPNIIKRTHIFDPVDNIYGEPGADYGGGDAGGEGEDGGAGGGGGAAGLGGGDMGGGDMPMDDGSMDGAEGEMGMDAAADAAGADAGGEMGMDAGGDMGGEAPVESLFTRKYKKILNERFASSIESVPLLDKNFLVNEELNNISKNLKEIVKNKENKLNS